MTPLERMARAMYAHEHGKYSTWDVDAVERGPIRDYWFAAARAALEVLAEPSAVMLAAALPDVSEPSDADKRVAAAAFTIISPGSDRAIQQAITAGAELARDWRSMIRAALAEGDGK